MEKVVGKVTAQERDEILACYERRNGLHGLVKIIDMHDKELYEKVVRDLGETETAFQSWWDRMAQKYQWESSEGGNWAIDFDTCEITLVQ